MSCPKCFTTAVSLENGEGYYTCGWCGQEYFIAEVQLFDGYDISEEDKQSED